MKRVIAVLSLLMTILCMSCSHLGHGGYEPIKANLVQAGLDVYDWIAADDSVLLAYNYYDSLMCHVLSDSRDSICLKDRFVYKGRGPGEFFLPVFTYDSDDGTLYVFETGRNTSNKMAVISVELEDKASSMRVMELMGCKDYSGGTAFTHLKGAQFLCLDFDFDAGGLLYMLDSDLQTMDKIYYPLCEQNTKNPWLDGMVHTVNATIYFNRSLSKLAYACGEGRYLEIMDYDPQNGTIRNRRPVLTILPEYEGRVLGNGMETYRIINDKYRGIKARMTENRIYVTYENESSSMPIEGYPKFYRDLIDVFDWNGNKVQSFQTDRPFGSFVVSKNDRYLYTVSQETDTANQIVCRYPLP